MLDAQNGTITTIDNDERIFYDGHWILYYAPPDDTLANHKILIESLTRRAFHNTERGINTPGEKLEEARAAYNAQTHPKRKRVNAAMLAGALFNRATDIFTSIVTLGELGVHVERSNPLMKQCSECFKEALELGRHVKHYSGEEGIDEIWGEPLKAFTLPIAQFYEQRYIKLAATMDDINNIAVHMQRSLAWHSGESALRAQIHTYAKAACREMETMKSDSRYFQIWPEFIAAREALESWEPSQAALLNADEKLLCRQQHDLLLQGCALIGYVSAARVPMPKSRENYFKRLAHYHQTSIKKNPVKAVI